MIICVVMLTTNSKAYENIIQEIDEQAYASITHINLSNNEKENMYVSTKNIGNSLEIYSQEIQTPGISPNAIIGFNDERELITDTTQYPYSAIAFIEITWHNTEQKGYGTAFMISPNKALTAAHCVYKDGQMAKKIQVIPAKNGPYFWNNPYGSAYAIDAFYPTAYESDTGTGNDWAILKLDKNIGNDCGWLDLQVGGFSFGPNGETFHASGYPVHDVKGSNYEDFRTEFLDNHYKEYQFHSSSIITDVDFKYFKHKIDILSGQSGAPIYKYDENNNIKVIGIHSRGIYDLLPNNERDYKHNEAVKITYTIINTISSF